MIPSDVAHNASMMLAFRAENVRSFRDEIELSLLATARAEAGVIRQIAWREGGQPIGVLPVAGLFGANASGKSNLLKAIDDMRTYVVDSFRQSPETLRRWPFLLDPAAKQKPSRYEMDLVLDGIRHEYGFVLDDEQIIEEWAIHQPRGRTALLFHRQGNRVVAGSTDRADTRAVERLLRPGTLFLSAAAAASHPRLLPLFEWFRRNLLLAETSNRLSRQAFTVEMLDRDISRERVLTLLRAADLGLVDARRHEMDPVFKERFAKAMRILAGNEGRDGDDIDAELTLADGGFSLTHKGVDGEVELNPVEESLGTVVWLGLAGPVIDALTDGMVLLADELDASLHPALVAQLVRLFQDPQTNPHRAQLIFNSHDTNVLGDSSNDRLLGRDQTWFTEKLNDGTTRLYPLTDLDPRKHEAVARRYLAGRYGATPIISRQQFGRIGELITSDD
jgi:AAA15 family ATPase/GTPase